VSKAGATLRTQAQGLSQGLPTLLAQARFLAASVVLGEHGRRRAGPGAEFWQYRPAMPGDEVRSIDWRRSARSDAHFVREKEWQAAQSVMLWVDPGQNMAFASEKDLPTKADRASLLAMAAAILLIDGGERVGLTALDELPRRGEVQLLRIADWLSSRDLPKQDYAIPELTALPRQSKALFLSDFMADISSTETAILVASDKGVTGAMVQVLDPQEEVFPFDGRTIFESMGGGITHETQKAKDLRERYIERLADRKEQLTRLAQRTGWQFMTHRTDQAALPVLLWLYGAIGQVG
jgi:uncharacterized protein (DUF58 family)